MIYLIKSHGFGKKSILKIGFTSNLEKRFYQYFTANPEVELISFREGGGGEILESLLHFYLKFLGLQYKKNGKLDEWFVDEIINGFKLGSL